MCQTPLITPEPFSKTTQYQSKIKNNNGVKETQLRETRLERDTTDWLADDFLDFLLLASAHSATLCVPLHPLHGYRLTTPHWNLLSPNRTRQYEETGN